jgi:hypothetical protein
LAGFAVPVFEEQLTRPEVPAPRAAEALLDVGRFATELPLVYWGAALLLSVLGLTAYVSSARSGRRALGALYYICSAAFVGAAGFTAVLIGLGMVYH